jgi:starch-binding outer membrane protein, SusD/RagB family
MLSQRDRARWVLAAFVAAPAFLTGCYVKDQLLAPQNPGLVDQTAVNNANAALALRVGAIGRVRNVVDGGDERLWQVVAHITDEYKNADFQVTRADIDRRTITTNNGDYPYATVTQPRGFIRDAITAMNSFVKDSTALIGELYMSLGFLEMSLGENYCNGIPLGHTVAGVVTLGPPLSNAQVIDSASGHLDSALAINKQSDVQGAFVRKASLILKARLLIDKGKFAEAAALVPESAVETSYQYLFTTSPSVSSGLEDNGHWNVQANTARMTVGDSFDLIAGQPNLIKNALPFASAKDPRVPVKGPTGSAEDGVTPMFIQLIWANRDDPIPMVSGIDARLIEGEAKLNAGDYAGMMAILNKLRTTSQKIGVLTVAAMPALTTTPTTKDAATTLFFREKAFWTFGRGQRLNDMRRLMRQYSRTEDQVFPTGKFSFGGVETGVYGHDVNLPIPDAELPNPEFKACTDRLP